MESPRASTGSSPSHTATAGVLPDGQDYEKSISLADDRITPARRLRLRRSRRQRAEMSAHVLGLSEARADVGVHPHHPVLLFYQKGLQGGRLTCESGGG